MRLDDDEKYCKDCKENELKEILNFREKIDNILDSEYHYNGFIYSNRLLKILTFIEDEIMTDKELDNDFIKRKIRKLNNE